MEDNNTLVFQIPGVQSNPFKWVVHSNVTAVTVKASKFGPHGSHGDQQHRTDKNEGNKSWYDDLRFTLLDSARFILLFCRLFDKSS